METIPFSYYGYEGLLLTLQKARYVFTDYHFCENYPRCVILRHDIDNSIDKALKIAELEAKLGIKSTYFVLMTSDFYNPASKKSLEGLRMFQELGHEIGLHFDEMAYDDLGDVVGTIQKEAKLLSDILGTPITTVSMHRPSQKTLDANYEIPGMINSYGKTFFNDFKYLSDSRRRWREPVLDIIKSGQYDRLQERYYQEKENIKDIESILDITEI